MKRQPEIVIRKREEKNKPEVEPILKLIAQQNKKLFKRVVKDVDIRTKVTSIASQNEELFKAVVSKPDSVIQLIKQPKDTEYAVTIAAFMDNRGLLNELLKRVGANVKEVIRGAVLGTQRELLFEYLNKSNTEFIVEVINEIDHYELALSLIKRDPSNISSYTYNDNILEHIRAHFGNHPAACITFFCYKFDYENWLPVIKRLDLSTELTLSLGNIQGIITEINNSNLKLQYSSQEEILIYARERVMCGHYPHITTMLSFLSETATCSIGALTIIPGREKDESIIEEGTPTKYFTLPMKVWYNIARYCAQIDNETPVTLSLETSEKIVTFWQKKIFAERFEEAKVHNQLG